MANHCSSIKIVGGRVFDGNGGPGQEADLRIEDGRIHSLGPPGSLPPADRLLDATGAWVTPGFVDMHTHYDAEVELQPALGESVRHGVTTVMLGSCGLSMVAGTPVDLADMFCRVEGIPRDTVLPLLERIKDWTTPGEYLEHLARRPLGPNVACMVGHSTLRAANMGMERALDASATPTAAEHAAMETMLQDALDAGFLGLSVNTLPWDKMDGEAHRSKPTPSVFATWSEYRSLAEVVRRAGAVLQGVPNLRTKWNVLLFMALSRGWLRRPLKTTLITMMDARSDRLAYRLVGWASRVLNGMLGGDFRMQALPHVFDLYTDGLEVPVMEEIGAGTEALHLIDPAQRAALLRDPAYRKRFKRQWTNALFGRAYHRNLDQTEVLRCPDAHLEGQSFGQIARARGSHPVDTLLDLVAEHGNALRWYTVVGNDRPGPLRWILSHPDVLMGFSDAGAHLRNMGYYNFPLRMLKNVHQAQQAGQPFMTIGRAVQRLSSEIADWVGIDAGRLQPGGRADLVVVDPAGLDDTVDAVHEAPMADFPGLDRVVRRNDAAVRHVLIGGRVAWTDGALQPALGVESGFGRVLRRQGRA